MRRPRFTRLVLLSFVTLLTASTLACGAAESDRPREAPTTASGEIDYSALRGTVRIDGSSTVFPITEAVAEEFSRVSRQVRANVGFSGTGGGIEKFCRGEIHIANASRAMREAERQKCAAMGIDDIVELQIAIDALSVVINPSNDFVDCLTVEELHRIFSTGGPRNWSEVRPGFPDQPLHTYYPGTDSGTFDYFREAVITGVEKTATHRGDGTASEDDNILAQGIGNDPNAIGYFGFAHLLESGHRLKALAIDNGRGCVEPTFDNALTGAYKPLSRPLYIYTRETFLEGRPEVLAFTEFYLEHLDELVAEVGYITMPPELKARQVAKIEPFLPGAS